jgi:hypothetical protein
VEFGFLDDMASDLIQLLTFVKYSIRASVFLVVCFNAAIVVAQPAIQTAMPVKKGQANLVIGSAKDVAFQLEVRQIALDQVLTTIQAKTGVPIHYSVLPVGLATATCVGSNLKPVLDCLLNRKADLIVRYQWDAVKERNTDQVVEAWVLDSRLDDKGASDNCKASVNNASQSSLTFSQSQNDDELGLQYTEQLIKRAQSEDKEERADAIGQLLTASHERDDDINMLLEQALNDSDALVRARAISSYTNRVGGNRAVEAIQDALHDSSADVRLQAVDSIGNDAALLQQAINDSDQAIRDLAAMKLETLTDKNPDKSE